MKRHRNEEVKRVLLGAVTKGKNPEIYQDLMQQLESPHAVRSTDPEVQEAKAAYDMWVERLDSSAAAAANQALPVPAAAGATAGVGAPGPAPMHDATTSAITFLGPRQEQEFARLRRDYEIHQKTYEEMKERLEQARITQRLGKSDEGVKFKVIEPARLPLSPFSPNLWLIFCGSLVAGAAAGIGMAFGAEFLDESFQSAEELQAAVELPVVGAISTIVTTADIEARNERRRSWVSSKDQLDRLNRVVAQPLWKRIDRALLKWGL
jgi:hypothetical protein